MKIVKIGGLFMLFLYVLLVDMVLTDISINVDVSGFYLDLKWQYSGQEKKTKQKVIIW